ncbi:MAG: leucyl/phenylalanyl-tRNA--protein transferase [Marinicaulis sp.]|nr:leucyl/phenylalanyl-tRNA--protein transferase [Marinicaulis sp.]NNL89412.1 leucyl/phenylalanyl-tRNA--protein transferase [Marinicaulis sp.]
MPRDSHEPITPDEIIRAYSLGYFPMARARDDAEVVWVLPDERGVIFPADAKMPKRLARTVRQEIFEIRVNTAFGKVLEACAEQQKSRPDTWINDAIIEVYSELHYMGLAHSVECWRGGKLAGGLYGVALGGVFCGESMFSRERDASKVAMAHLMARIKAGGFKMIDAQFYNEHLVQFGLIGLPNEDYQTRLQAALLESPLDVFGPDYQSDTTSVLQSITQTS